MADVAEAIAAALAAATATTSPSESHLDFYLFSSDFSRGSKTTVANLSVLSGAFTYNLQ